MSILSVPPPLFYLFIPSTLYFAPPQSLPIPLILIVQSPFLSSSCHWNSQYKLLVLVFLGDPCYSLLYHVPSTTLWRNQCAALCLSILIKKAFRLVVTCHKERIDVLWILPLLHISCIFHLLLLLASLNSHGKHSIWNAGFSFWYPVTKPFP